MADKSHGKCNLSHYHSASLIRAAHENYCVYKYPAVSQDAVMRVRLRVPKVRDRTDVNISISCIGMSDTIGALPARLRASSPFVNHILRAQKAPAIHPACVRANVPPGAFDTLRSRA